MAQSIAEAAAAALAAQEAEAERFRRQLRDELVRVCRARLGVLLGDSYDVAALSVAESDVDNFLVVFTDGQHHLAVHDADDVWLVVQEDGRWTGMGEPALTSLADLGERLAKRQG